MSLSDQLSRNREAEPFQSSLNNVSFRIPVTPLRYPGGKRKLAPLLHNLISLSEKEIEMFVEPFVGGGSIAISFLERHPKTCVALADADPLVAAFWSVTFSSEASLLAERIANTKPTIALWRKIKSSSPKNELDLAFKCFYLNRTSFSGIIHDSAGPIGGFNQTSEYPIDCRFNSESLAKRVIELSNYRERVRFVRCQSWKKTISDVRRTELVRLRPDRVFWYLDPPFFQKAGKLYRFIFLPKDHQQLKAHLDHLPGSFLLSYDDVPEARRLYGNHGGFAQVNLAYNARIDRIERLAANEIIVSDLIRDLREGTQANEIGNSISLPERRRAENPGSYSICLERIYHDKV